MAIINQVVSGGGSAPAHYVEKNVDANGELSPDGVTTAIDLSGVTKIGEAALAYAYYKDTTITQAPDFSNVTTVKAMGLNNAFYGCANLTGVINFDNLTTINGSSSFNSAFSGTKITGFNIKKLSASTQNCFRSAFAGCTNLATLKFESLSTVSLNTYVFVSMCDGASSMQSIWFYALINPGNNSVWENMLNGVTGCAVHFPIVTNWISPWSNVSRGFGGTNTTVLFDLVTSLTGADTNTYTRSEKDSTATATAWAYNNTLYYTSGVSDNTNGVNEPAVGDTIYSDSACTTAVTTVDAIA